MSTGFVFRVMAAGTISLLIAVAARADRLSQDEALRLRETGQIRPLEALLERHADRLEGRLVDLELEREHGRLVYEIKLMAPDGRLREVMIDAASGEWLGEED